MIAALLPNVGVGNTLPVIIGTDEERRLPANEAAMLLANFNAIPFDYIARQKIQGQHVNWYIVEQLPVVPLPPLRIHPLRPQNRRPNHPRSRP